MHEKHKAIDYSDSIARLENSHGRATKRRNAQNRIPGWGVQNVPKATEGGGELTPKVAPRKLGLLTPKLATFYRISVERGQFQGPLEIQNFHPPSNFRRFAQQKCPKDPVVLKTLRDIVNYYA